MFHIHLELADLRINQIIITKTKGEELLRPDSFATFLYSVNVAATMFNLVRTLIDVIKVFVENLTTHRQRLIMTEKLLAFENAIAEKDSADEECAERSKLCPEFLMAMVCQLDFATVHVEVEAFVSHSINCHMFFPVELIAHFRFPLFHFNNF